MSQAEIKEYREMEDMLKETLENTYSHFLLSGDKVQAHETLKTLMAYKLVTRNDLRVQTNCKLFGGANGVNVKDPNSWGYLDYRKIGTDFMPKYIFCGLGDYSMIEVETYPHWGKRAEGNYTGDIHISSTKHRIRMFLVNKPQSVKNAVQDMFKLSTEYGINLGDEKETTEEATVGVLRIYQLSVTTSVEHHNRNFGYVILKMNNDGKMMAAVLYDYNSILNTWCNINEFNTKVNESINTLVDCDEGCDIIILGDFKKWSINQSERVKIEQEKDKSRDKLIEKENNKEETA